MTKIALLLVFLWGLPLMDEVPKLVRVKVTKNISVALPQDFRPMTDDEIAAKYFTYRKPAAMYTDSRKSVDFGVNLSECEWTYDDIPLLHGIYRSSIKTMFTNVEMITDEVREIGRHKFIVYEFVAEIVPDRIDRTLTGAKPVRSYYLMYYTIKDNELVVFNFNCALKYKQQWQETARAVMKSINL